MATTGIVNATLMKLYVGGTALSDSTNASISITMSPRDTTTKDSGGWGEFLEGRRDWTASGSFLFAEDATYGINDILSNLITTRASVAVKFSTEVAGDTRYTGTAWITSASKSAGVEDNVTYDLELQGTGAISTETVT